EDVMRPLWRRLVSESIPHWSTGDQTKTLTLDLRGFNQLSIPYQRRLMKKFLLVHGLESGYNAVQTAIGFMGGEDRDDLETGLLSVGYNAETQLPIYLSTYRGQLQVVSAKFASHAA